MAKDNKPEAKQYSLTGIETQLLKVTQQNFQTVLSNEMAMIAVQRLNYPVSLNTRFVFNDDMREVTISEDEPTEAGVISE
jgi:hypothetical protein